MPGPAEEPFKFDHVKTGNFIGDKLANGLIDKVNKLDVNHNEIPDVAEAVPLLLAAVPILNDINKAVDFELLLNEVSEAPWIKDKAAFAACLRKLGHLIEVGGALLPKGE